MDPNSYQELVLEKLAPASKDFDTLIARLHELKTICDERNLNWPEIQTGANGLSAEAGEFQEIVKKMLYQGKPLDDQNILHMRKELGDALFYIMVACDGLNISFQDMLDMNADKLRARYKGAFTVEESENRAAGDL